MFNVIQTPNDTQYKFGGCRFGCAYCYPDSSLQYGLQAFSSGILPRAIGNEEDIFSLQPDIFVTAIQNFFD